MTLFRYEAIAASGERVSGELDAAAASDVADRLHADGHVPIRVEAATGKGAAIRLGGATRKGGSRSADLPLLTEQLATLLHAGLSLDRALDIAQTLIVAKPAREALRSVLDRVRGGASLADAMAAQPLLFPAFYVGMVRAGEAGGSLDQTLRQLAEYLERSQAAREQVRSALLYPMIVLSTGIGSIAVLFGFVIPRFRPIFEDAGTALPLPAQIILAVSDVFRDDGWILLAALAVLVIGALRLGQAPALRARWDQIVLRLPVAGALVVKGAIARFARTLGTLLRNGVPPLTALSITEETIGNLSLREAIAGIAPSIKEGKGFAEPLAQIAVIPPLVVHLTRVGEETARLDEMLLKLADIFDAETKRGVEHLLALLVPAITIAMGAIVALVIGSILTAILSVYDLAV